MQSKTLQRLSIIAVVAGGAGRADAGPEIFEAEFPQAVIAKRPATVAEATLASDSDEIGFAVPPVPPGSAKLSTFGVPEPTGGAPSPAPLHKLEVGAHEFGNDFFDPQVAVGSNTIAAIESHHAFGSKVAKSPPGWQMAIGAVKP